MRRDEQRERHDGELDEEADRTAEDAIADAEEYRCHEERRQPRVHRDIPHGRADRLDRRRPAPRTERPEGRADEVERTLRHRGIGPRDPRNGQLRRAFDILLPRF